MDNYEFACNSGVRMPGDDGYLLGAHVYKDFVGHGGIGGHVVAYDKSEMWYLVTYTYGDQEDMTADEVIEIVTEMSAPGMWFHDSGQYGWCGKAHASVSGSLYYIEIPETRYMAGATGLFLYTGTEYMPFRVSTCEEGNETIYRHQGELVKASLPKPQRREVLHEVAKHRRRARGDTVPRLKPM